MATAIPTAAERSARLRGEGKLVRDWTHGRGKFHIPTDDGTATLCGRTPSSVGGFPVTTDRAQLEARGLDNHLCKSCVAAEGDGR